jgi:hypothetical protein
LDVRKFWLAAVDDYVKTKRPQVHANMLSKQTCLCFAVGDFCKRSDTGRTRSCSTDLKQGLLSRNMLSLIEESMTGTSVFNPVYTDTGIPVFGTPNTDTGPKIENRK